MAKEVYVPKLGQTMEEARLVKWLVADGTLVEEGQGLLEVETDKAVFTVEANARGHLHIGPYKEDDIVPVLTIIATIGKPEETFSGAKPVVDAQPAKKEQPPSAQTRVGETVEHNGKVFASPRARNLADAKGVDLARVSPTGDGGVRVVERDVLAFLTQLPKATPVAQRVAAETGIDLSAITGTGVGGAITKEDVERAAQRSVSKPPSEVFKRVPLKGVRGIIADRMATSAHATARVTLFMEVDATELVSMRERLKARVEKEWGFAPGYNDILAMIVARALREFPYLNARMSPDAIEWLAHVNIGIAVDTERGLYVPVIPDADKKSLREFGLEFRARAERARAGKSLPDDLTGGTFTITNLGMYDIFAFTPIINLPEAAILGVGTITPQPVVRDGHIVVREILTLSLAFDHRLTDGAPAARFLQRIKNLVEEPYLLATV